MFVEEDDNDEEDELSSSPPEGLLAFNDLEISLRMFSLMDILKFCKSNSLSLVLSKLFSSLVEGVGGDECLYSASSGFGWIGGVPEGSGRFVEVTGHGFGRFGVFIGENKFEGKFTGFELTGVCLFLIGLSSGSGLGGIFDDLQMEGKLTGLSGLIVGGGINLGSVKGDGQSRGWVSDGWESGVVSDVGGEVTVVTTGCCWVVVNSSFTSCGRTDGLCVFPVGGGGKEGEISCWVRPAASGSRTTHGGDTSSGVCRYVTVHACGDVIFKFFNSSEYRASFKQYLTLGTEFWRGTSRKIGDDTGFFPVK